jgi:hypothetical protein
MQIWSGQVEVLMFIVRWYQLFSRLLVLFEKLRLIARYLTTYLAISHHFTQYFYNTRISYVMAITRKQLGSC